MVLFTSTLGCALPKFEVFEWARQEHLIIAQFSEYKSV